MPRSIPLRTWASTDTVGHARNLLGKHLVVRESGGTIARHLITETEAYDGPEDRACHASRGHTARTAVMFGPAGHWYVYLCYGVHEMLNLVTGPAGYPAAVLVRAVSAASGPGRLTRRLAIDRRFNALPAMRPTGLWLEDSGILIPDTDVLRTPRIGIAYAGPEWAAKPWRFVWQPRTAQRGDSTDAATSVGSS